MKFVFLWGKRKENDAEQAKERPHDNAEFYGLKYTSKHIAPIST
jgi:hypothetical protein